MNRNELVRLIKEEAREKNIGLLIEARKFSKRKPIIKTSTGGGGDAVGKAFEVHVAKHIGHILRGGDDPEQHYPSHFSDESGDTPHASVQKQKKVLGSALHDQVESHARRMAHHIINHMRKHEGIELDHTSQVHWTSKPKDLERLTGKQGVKSTADITISHKGEHHGISLKYSTSGTKPSLRSPGIKDLTHMLKADHKHVDRLVGEHDKNVHIAVGSHVGNGPKSEKHSRFKVIAKTKPKVAQKALEASKTTHKALAQHFGDSFNKLKHHEKASFVRKMIDAEEQPTIKPYRASYDAARGSTHVTNPTKDFDHLHANVKHYTAEVSGQSINVHAHMKDGSKVKVTSVGLKNKGSSPFSGLASRVADVTPVKKK